MDWNQIWTDIKTFFTTNAWNIVIFFAVLLFGIIAIKLILNVTRRILNKTKMEKIAIGFLMVILKVVLYLCLILSLFGIIGINVNGILTAISAMFLAVGLALQNNISNMANGIIIVSTKMFKKGDYIKVDGVEGSVVGINFLFTTLMTPDNKRVTVPNSSIVNGSVTDFDSSKTRRVDVKVEVAYESDIELVKKVVLDTAKSNGKVLLDPEPTCRISSFNASAIELTLKCWCDSEDYWSVYFDCMENIFNEFKRNNISIPYNQLEIRERKDVPPTYIIGDKLPERQEKIRKEEHNFDLEKVDFAEIFTKNRNKKKNKKKDIKKQKNNKNTNEKEELSNDETAPDSLEIDKLSKVIENQANEEKIGIGKKNNSQQEDK